MTRELRRAASMHGSDAEVRALLAGGAAPNAVAVGQDSALCLAARLRRIDSVRMLIAAGADPSHSGRDAARPLEHAIGLPDPEIMELLLEAGAAVDGTTVFAVIDAGDDVELARRFAARGAQVEQRHLHAAIAQRRSAISSWLLDEGVGADAATLLTLVEGGDDLELAHRLALAGAIAEQPHVVAAVRHRRVRVLQWLLGSGSFVVDAALAANALAYPVDTGLLAVLLEHGGIAATEIFEIACQQPDPQLAALAIARGARPEGAIRTRLVTAARAGATEMMTILIETGWFDVTAVDATGTTIAMHAATSGDADAVALAVRCGASVSARDHGGWTVLHHALPLDSVPLVQRIAAMGCELDEVDKHGWSLLTHACAAGARSIAEWLIERGMELDRADTVSGATPLLVATAAGHEAITDLLVSRGADTTRRTIPDGRTVAVLAAFWSHGYAPFFAIYQPSASKWVRKPPGRRG